MKYIANPVEVEAERIEKIIEGSSGDDGHPMILQLENGKLYSPNAGMLARMTPVPGDYVVTQSDGYVYLNPKDVFERKYRKPVVNNLPSFLLPHDGPVAEGLEAVEVVYAKDQPQYLPLRTIRGKDDYTSVLSRWSPTVEQRQTLNDGGDIFLELASFGHPLTPIRVFVVSKLPPDWVRREYRL